jgi:hypothetical protein
MKSTLWMAVLVLVLMVGGITFVSVYLGGGNRGDGKDAPPDVGNPLIFPIRNFPGEGQKSLTTEVRQTGHHDFWFFNEGGKDVAVGLQDKGCTCSEAELTVAPASWLQRIHGSVAMQALQLPLRRWDNLTSLAALRELGHVASEWPLDGAATVTFDKENSITVPANAIGRLRLSWRQDGPQPLQAWAMLWIGARGGSLTTRLDATVRIAEPLEVNRDVTLPSVTVRQLEKEEVQPAWILCWSTTRRDFSLAAEPDNPRFKKESDPVEIGEPVPLSASDFRWIESEPSNSLVNVLSGYKIPVRLHAKAKDGTPMDWGSFRRYIRLSSPTGDINPLIVQVYGEVVGDVGVTGGKMGGIIDLGPFPRKRGAKGNITLHSDDKNLELEVDKNRLPEFLWATLGKAQDTGGHLSWLLEVEVPPGAANGEFPNANNPSYRDSAIYVKTKSKQPHWIRVPVVGVANIR